MDEMVCIFGVSADELSKKQIQNIYNEVYTTDDLSPEFHSIYEYNGYVVFKIMKSYTLDAFSYSELEYLRKQCFPISAEKEIIYRDFFNKINKPELFDELDLFVYVSRDSVTDSFYSDLRMKKQ